MHSDWFNGIDILQGRWQHGEKVGYCYSSGLENTLCKWEVYVPLVTKGLSPKYVPGGESLRPTMKLVQLVFFTRQSVAMLFSANGRSETSS
jgi:hypothetical protein